MAYDAEIIEGQATEIACRHYGPAGATVGVRGAPGTSIGFDDRSMGRHVLFIGGIGTGKTVGMSALIATVRASMSPEDTIVFFDTKGDYIETFFRPGDISLSADPGASFPGGQRWNLFAELAHTAPNELAELSQEVSRALIQTEPDDRNRIWTSMASDLLASLIVAYVRSGNKYSNRDLRAMADKLTVSQMRSILLAHADLRGVAQYIANDSSNTTTTSVLIFFQEAVRRVFSGAFKLAGDFSAVDFIRQRGGRALFLEHDVSRAGTSAPVFRLVLDMILRDRLGRASRGGRTYFVLDEFSLLPLIPHLDAGLNFGRSLGLRFIVGTQNVGQVARAYGDDGGASVLSAFGTVFSFRLFDQASRDFVRGRYGRNRKIVYYDTSLKTRGIGESMIDGSVIEDWDLSTLGVGQAIVSLPDRSPLKFVFAPPQN